MGKFIKKVEPTEAAYLVELNQSEVDLIQGLLSDLSDASRKIRMDYSLDGSYVSLSERGLELAKSASMAFAPIGMREDYDYFDYWEEADRDNR